MKEEIINERHSDATDEKIDIQELLFKYIIHWPWFVGAVLICLVGAWIYLRMATPIYNISVRGEKRCVSKFGRSEKS